ncbi:hypothetical protein DFJ74DRAFT_684171 [Hyaloraphidium curvatum]|nr:hypothetical protein DFJ74DRAFT_684171 [Hyaloraphidium curvatum]
MAAGCKIMRPKLCISPHYRLENLPMHNYFVSRDETADQIWIDKLPAYANASAPVPCFLSPADVEAQKGGGSKRRVNFRLFPPFDCRFPAATLPQNKDTLAETILPGGVYGIPEPHFMETPLLDRWVLEYANTEWLVPREEFFHVIRQIHDNPMFWRDKTDRPEDKWYYYSAHVRLSDLKIFCEVTASAASECGVDIAKVPAFLAAEIAAIEGPGRNYSSHIYIATDASSQEIAQLEDAFAALDPALVGPGLTVTISSADWYKALLYDVMKQIYPVYTVDQGGANYTTWERNMRHEKMMTIVLDQLMLGCGERMWGTRASGFSERAYQMGVHPYKLGMCGRNMPWGQRRRARDEKERMGYLPAVKDWKREPDPEASPTTAAAMTTNTAMAGK